MTAQVRSFWQAFAPNSSLSGARVKSADCGAAMHLPASRSPLSRCRWSWRWASPAARLVTAIIAGFLISLLGGSRVQIGGPTGAFVVIVAGVIAAHGYAGLVVATLLAGFILIAAGYAGIGRLVRFIPMPVITGFTAGIAVIIASSQVGDFLGLRTGALPAEFIPKWATYFSAISSVNVFSGLCASGAR